MATATFVGHNSGVTTGASLSVAAPTGTLSGDHQLLIVVSGTSGTAVATPSGFTRSGDYSGTAGDSTVNLSIFRASNSTATGSISITNPTSTRLLVVVRASWRGGPGWLATPAPTGTTRAAATTHALPTQATTAVDQLVVGSIIYDTGDGTGLTTNFSMPAPWVERAEINLDGGFETIGVGIFTAARTASGTQSGTVTASRSDASYVWAATLGAASTPPDVSVGEDIFSDQYETVTRTATENDGGSAITSRAWTVQSGPNQVGATIGTAAALSWAPTVGGDYVLRYTATNSSGSDFDELTVFVNPLNFPVTANLKLTGTRVGAKRVSGSATAPLLLAATRVGAKRGSFSPTANITIDASIFGLRLNIVSATIKLHTSINGGRPGQGSVTATLKLHGSGAATRVTIGITRTANIVLDASSVGTSDRTNVAVAEPIILDAIQTGAKSVPDDVDANILLDASVANVFHASNGNALANLILHGAVSDLYHSTVDVDTLAILILHATPVTSSVRFHTNVDGNLILRATAFGQRIITEVAGAVLPRADNTTQYELVCVARIPQTGGAPVFIEVDPIDWTQITHTDELSVIPSLSASAKISNMTEPVLQRLRNMAELPTELWLYRNGKQVFSGPLLGWTVNNESLTMEAQGLMSYLKMMYVTQDLVYKDVDQFEIVTGLINQWQNLDYGNFGIDTAEIPPSGVLRTVTYTYKELHNVAQRIDDLTKMVNGFDISIDPAKRKLELYFPFRGIDRSFGEDKIVFDARNVTSTNIACSASPTDLASEGLGTGTGTGADEAFVSTASNAELRARYGRTGITSTFDQVTDQASLDSYVQAMIDARGTTLMIPGPNARVTIDADVGAYDVGDTVDYQLHSQLAVSGSFRIRKRTITVAETGTESVSIEFV